MCIENLTIYVRKMLKYTEMGADNIENKWEFQRNYNLHF